MSELLVPDSLDNKVAEDDLSVTFIERSSVDLQALRASSSDMNSLARRQVVQRIALANQGKFCLNDSHSMLKLETMYHIGTLYSRGNPIYRRGLEKNSPFGYAAGAVYHFGGTSLHGIVWLIVSSSIVNI